MGFVAEATMYLAAAVLVVPIAKRLGLGSVLGYLVAGAVIGPSVLGLVADVENVLHVAELGVVLLLFIIGLELEPSRLWTLRRVVFGFGTAQVLVTTALLTALGVLVGLRASEAVIAAAGLSLSSTAIALQTLADKDELGAPHGRIAFSILLLQDLAVIPLLALVPVIAGVSGDGPPWGSIAKTVGVLIVVVFGGRLVVRPFFRIIARTKVQEIFTAAALLVVVATALLMQSLGLSAALGAFLAGVLLADSEYRHEIEADIEPFKGLLLGLFFVAVGMSANLGLVVERPVAVGLGVLLLLAIKGAVLAGLARPARLSGRGARRLALVLAQGGEFAFVLFGVAVGAGAMGRELGDWLVVVVWVSMALTPVLIAVQDRWLEPLLEKEAEARVFDKLDDAHNPVIIAGFGRYGQIVARMLGLVKIGFTAIEISSEQVDFVRRFGNKVYYGDASRIDLLRAARADQAKVFVLAIDDVEASARTAEVVKRNFPSLPIYARARNRQHAYKLLDIGVHLMNRETFGSSLEMAQHVLVALGYTSERAREMGRVFRDYDEEMLKKQHAVYQDEAKLIQTSKEVARELQAIFEQDAQRTGPVP